MLNGGCLRWPEGSVWEHIISRHHSNGHIIQTFHHLLWVIQGTMPCCFGFWQILHFMEFSQTKKVDKWPDVSQLAYGVRNHSNLAWMTTMCMHTFLKKLVSFQECPKLDHVQWRVFGLPTRLRLWARCISTSFEWARKNFYHLLWPIQGTIPSCFGFRVFFCIFWSFLSQKCR